MDRLIGFIVGAFASALAWVVVGCIMIFLSVGYVLFAVAVSFTGAWVGGKQTYAWYVARCRRARANRPPRAGMELDNVPFLEAVRARRRAAATTRLVDQLAAAPQPLPEPEAAERHRVVQL